MIMVFTFVLFIKYFENIISVYFLLKLDNIVNWFYYEI